MNCQLCPSLCANRSKIVLPCITPPNGLLVVGEAPGGDEDRVGKGFVGKAGQTLAKELEAIGIHSRMQYGRANTAWCWPEGNRKPTKTEIKNCTPHLADFIKKYPPRVILTVGGTASNVFLGNGALSALIELQARNEWSAYSRSMFIQDSLADVIQTNPKAMYIVPMPHVSPLAWNRNHPDGRKWSEVGREQIQIAGKILKGAPE